MGDLWGAFYCILGQLEGVRVIHMSEDYFRLGRGTE